MNTAQLFVAAFPLAFFIFSSCMYGKLAIKIIGAVFAYGYLATTWHFISQVL